MVRRSNGPPFPARQIITREYPRLKYLYTVGEQGCVIAETTLGHDQDVSAISSCIVQSASASRNNSAPIRAKSANPPLSPCEYTRTLYFTVRLLRIDFTSVSARKITSLLVK